MNPNPKSYKTKIVMHCSQKIELFSETTINLTALSLRYYKLSKIKNKHKIEYLIK